MKNKESQQATMPIEPLYDTWGAKKYAGFWGITQPFDFTSLSVAEVNAWYVTSTYQTLDTFSQWARAFEVSFRALSSSEVRVSWSKEESYCTYLERVAQAIQEYPAPIYSLDILVDLKVYVRTPASSKRPVQAWVRLPSEFRIWGGPENVDATFSFNVAHTLFAPWGNEGQDNRELLRLNQPRLEQALCRWEQRFGPISDYEGLSGIFEYGFEAPPLNVERENGRMGIQQELSWQNSLFIKSPNALQLPL